MKKVIILLLLLTGILIYKVKAQNPIDRAVRCEVEIKSNTSLELTWVQNQYATSYDLYRRQKGEATWGGVLSSLPGNSAGYLDENVSPGVIYEYRIFRRGNGGFAGYGYVMAGIEVDPIQFGQRVLLVVEQELADSIPAALDMLKTDLAMAGWNVNTLTVAASKTAKEVKDMIDASHLSQPVHSVYILGHVPVPYSGLYCATSGYLVPPDGHSLGQGNHCGAWPADVYYGVLDGFWSDTDSTTVGTRTHTANRIGDGKWDQIEIPGVVELMVGRVDLSNLPAFPKSEENLIRQYIQKSHDYRNNISVSYQRGVVDDNFKGFAESFSTTGWRNFAAMFGRDNVVEQDFFTTVKDSIYMFSMLDGAGSFTSCNGIGTTTDYANNNASAMFNFTFGSFFGDWDFRNNLLRAALATEKGGLTNGWSGRPWWHAHPMALGHDIGYCTRLTQNNRNQYFASFFGNNIHIALMGDPTLRLYAFAPPTNVVVTPNGTKESADISWTASTDGDVTGYDVYVSTYKYGYYEKLNSSPISGTTYNQANAYNGTNYYLVRARKLETTHSGSFTNYSQGAFGQADNMVGETRNVEEVSYKNAYSVYPNPAQNSIQIEFLDELPKTSPIRILSIDGREVKVISSAQISTKTSINVSDLQRGMYLIQIGNSVKRVVLN